MAWNTITYACAHTEQVQLYGPTVGRDRAVAAATSHDCPACRAAKAAKQDAENGLPALVGSEKQVGWASECRALMLPLLAAEEQRLMGLLARIDSGDLPNNPPADKVAAARADIVKGLERITKVRASNKAAYWIDNRSTDARTIIASA
jgi:hypothetical protein